MEGGSRLAPERLEALSEASSISSMSEANGGRTDNAPAVFAENDSVDVDETEWGKVTRRINILCFF